MKKRIRFFSERHVLFGFFILGLAAGGYLRTTPLWLTFTGCLAVLGLAALVEKRLTFITSLKPHQCRPGYYAKGPSGSAF